LINTDAAVFSEAFIATAILSWIVYNVSSIVLVHRHRKNLENEFSSIERNVKIGWILFIIIFYSSFCILVFGIGAYSFFTGTHLIITHSVTYSGFLVLVYILGYYGLKQRKIFEDSSNLNLSEKYEKSFLTPDKKKEIKGIILSCFETEKAFLNPELNMDLLAVQINIPKHQITEVLSTEIGKNFFQFVNSYRVEAVKKKLKDESNPYSIEAIGYDCGFNSKSSFFTVFKKLTGKTPLQYKNSIISNPE
jgi:AraC-like DNA-binding protein